MGQIWYNPSRRLQAWVTTLLALGACTFLPWLRMAVEREDVEVSESPLMLAVARQLTHRPSELYGPYGGRNPLVLIHPPLYYRAAALCALPMTRAGVDAETAARVAGRSLSLLGWTAILAGAFFLARLQGAPPVAGWWAGLLAAATPVYGGLPVEVRPDMVAVAFQTWGVFWLMRALLERRPRSWMIVLAFICYALAGGAKAHLVITPAVSTFFLVGVWKEGRVGWKLIAAALLVDLVILVTYFVCEEWATAGRMSRSIFAAARECTVIHPSNWQNAGNFMLVLGWKCVGLILLLAAASVAAVSARAGKANRLLSTAGAAVVGLVAILTAVQIFAVAPGISRLIVLGLVVTMACLALNCAVALRQTWRTCGIDLALAVYLAAELALTAFLVKQSTGAWYNYAVQAVVFASILAARVVARAVQRPLPARALLAVALAVFAVPAFALTDVREVSARRRAESFWLGKLFERVQRTPRSLFFADRPGLNRVHGRGDLVYDPWLYPVFEHLGFAEPRSDWLAHELESGPVRLIVTTAPQTQIDGIPLTLNKLGYSLRLRIGPWLIWVRQPRQASTAF